MLKRKMENKLLSWAMGNASKAKALLLDGARQTGKTFTVREFARSHYDSFVEVNLIENPSARSLLMGASDSDDFTTRLSLLAERPFGDGKTLVFFDEVQAFPEVITLSKFLVDQGRFDLVMSGSLLGVELKKIRSFPVGYLHEERMYPLDFEEFCWSQGVPQRVLDEVGEAFAKKRPLDESLHDRLIKLYRLYIIVGGMPEAVEAYISSSHDLTQVRAIQSDIVKQYGTDIVRYTDKRTIFVDSIWKALPGELSKINKRFVLNSLKNGAVYERFENDFEWLMAAGVVLPAYHCCDPSFPLERGLERRKFKLYSSDVGLLMSRFPRGVASDVLQGVRSVNFGAVYENVVAQELISCGFGLCYYNNNRKGEVDFLIQDSTGKVIPLEVKSGKGYKLHTALNNLLSCDGYGMERAYVLSEANLSKGQKAGKDVFYLPLYMTMCLIQEELGPTTCNENQADPPSFDDWA